VNADIREKCDELAEQGFIAIAPDLFWRQEPGVDLGVRSGQTGSMDFASIKSITEMKVLRTSRTP
jgi:dienelactone hydrolase